MIDRPTLTIICSGDSITDCDCVKPPIVKETTLMRDLGYGYVNFLFGTLSLLFQDKNVVVLNHGVGGDRTIKLLNRFDQVISQKSDILTIMIGVNDVWAKFYASDRPDVQTSIDEYVQYLKHMIEKAKPTTKQIILLSPFYLDLSPNNAFLVELNKRQQAMKQIAEEYGLHYIDLQHEFAQILKLIPVSNITTDFIHVNAIGHMLIAQRLLSDIKEMMQNV